MARVPAESPASDRARNTRGQRTRRRLLDAGAVVFAARGYHAARVDDVVKEAKTSHGTFYLYFANKEELFGALVVEVSERMCALAADFPALHGTDTRSHLRAWIARFAELYREYGSVIRAWGDAEIGSDELGALGANTLAEFTNRIAERIGELPPTGTEPRVAALATVAMIERSLFYVASDPPAVPLDAMLDALAALLLAGVTGAS